jgi:hypothetical protein
MAIAVPTGIKIFNWLGTMWSGRLSFATPMLFSTAFLFQFLVGGLTGVMLAVVPFDWQVSDSYFVVAHFHYVLIGGLVFLFFAAIYYGLATGRMLDERLKHGTWLSVDQPDHGHPALSAWHAAADLHASDRSRPGHHQPHRFLSPPPDRGVLLS